MSGAHTVGLSTSQVDALFPFHLALDRDMSIVHAGPAWDRHCASIRAGTRAPELLAVVRPTLPLDFATLAERSESSVVIQCLPTGLLLRGRMLLVDDGRTIAFFGSPWVTDTRQLADTRLSLADFPAHDSLSELLFLLQTKNSALEDARRLSQRLADQGEALRRANEELASTRARLEHLFAASPAVIFSFRADGDHALTFMSDNLATLSGFDAAQCRDGIFLAQQIHPEDRPLIMHRTERVLATGRDTCEYRVRHADGVYHWAREEVRLVRADDGTPLEVVGAWIDVTEHKRAEALILAQNTVAHLLAGGASLEEAGPTILEAVGTALGWQLGSIFTVDEEQDVLRCACVWPSTGPFEDYLRDSRTRTFRRNEGLPGRAWAQGRARWVNGARPDAAFPRSAIALEAGIHSAITWPIRSGKHVLGVAELLSREDVPPDESARRALEAIGAQIGMFIERNRSEAALRASAAHLRLVIDTALDAVIMIDAAGKVRGWNTQAERTLGWSREEALGRPMADLVIPPETRDAHTRGLARFVATGEARVLNRRIEIEAMHRSGRRFPVELTITPVTVDGELTFSGFVRDISDRKRAELDIQRAKAAAEAASEAKSRFLATMSHEIRTPLNPIFGWTGVLMDTALSPEQRRYVERIRQSGQLLLRQINQVLDFSKIEAERVELEQSHFSLRSVVSQIVDLFAGRAREKGLELEETYAADLPRIVRGDSARLQQVLSNLLANAIKFTASGRIQVRTLRGSDPDLLRFEVTDTGEGVPESQQGTLFDPFVQADTSTTRRHGGSGLGLAIAKGLVVLMGGEIGVRSAPGAGSSFWFTARLPESRDDAVEPPLPALPEPTAVRQRHEAGARILLAEDNPGNQDVMVLMLERLGHRVDVVPDGGAAVEAYGRAPYDLVLMDCQMPIEDGFAATRRIREIEGTGRHTPIVAITAFAVGDDRERCFAAGMDDFLPKPISFDSLAETLDRWLAHRERTPSETGEPAVDASVIAQLRALDQPGRPSLVAQLLERFVERAPRVAEELQRARREADLAALEHVAHNLKSESGNLGARALSLLADALQRAARAGRSDEAEGLVDRICHEIDRARAALREVLAAGPSPTDSAARM